MVTVKELAKAHRWNLPEVCPECGGKLVLSDNHKMLFCGNSLCRSYSAGRILKWTNTMKIKEFGPATIETIVNLGYKDISSLYDNSLYIKMKNMEGFGEQSVNKMAKEVKAHLKCTLAQFIAGYNISDIGEKVIQKIISEKHYESVSDFAEAKASDFICEGVGEITAGKLNEGISKLYEDMQKTLQSVKIIAEEKPAAISGNLNGKSFCFTGAASRPRKELQAMVISNGGVVMDSVKKGLDYLVIADPNSTSSKAVKARKDGVTLISEDEFVKMATN